MRWFLFHWTYAKTISGFPYLSNVAVIAMRQFRIQWRRSSSVYFQVQRVRILFKPFYMLLHVTSLENYLDFHWQSWSNISHRQSCINHLLITSMGMVWIWCNITFLKKKSDECKQMMGDSDIFSTSWETAFLWIFYLSERFSGRRCKTQPVLLCQSFQSTVL